MNDPIRTPSPTPISDPSPPGIMEEGDVYDTPSFAQELGLGSQSGPMYIQPEIVTETTDPNLGPNQNLPEADQDDEEVFYDCRSQSTEEIDECWVGLGTPTPRPRRKNPES